MSKRKHSPHHQQDPGEEGEEAAEHSLDSNEEHDNPDHNVEQPELEEHQADDQAADFKENNDADWFLPKPRVNGSWVWSVEILQRHRNDKHRVRCPEHGQEWSTDGGTNQLM